MTNEKTMRTREEQIREMTHGQPDGLARAYANNWAKRYVLEAEARGAAQARAEDAKGQEPFGYLLEDDANHLKHPDGLEQFGEYCDQKCEGFQVAIYTRPANVAELEARVAHLEAALLKIRDSDTFCGSQHLRHIAGKALKK